MPLARCHPSACRWLVSLLLATGCCGVQAMTVPSVSSVSLLPLPAHMTSSEGNFVVDDNTPVVVGDDAASLRTAQWLTGLLARTRGLQLRINPSGHAANSIALRLDPRIALTHDEAYVLDVTPQQITVTARTDAGLFRGATTLWQLLTPDARQGAVTVPALHIGDQPRFVWRGLMLDSARHFQGVDEVKLLLEQMAQHKLNVLHWHLTDDQGWRIEIKRYPELTRIGAWRTPPGAGQDGEPARYGGFYTQPQIREVVAYAAARFITVVPEIDMPGHAQAAVAAYPQLGVTGQRPRVSTDWGVNPYLYNVDDATFDFIGHVLDEVMAMFPSTYIHVGGDEAIKDQWKASPAVQAKMHALGLKDEDALQGWFIARVGNYLHRHGRRLIGWDEILDGSKLPNDAAVMSWRGTNGAVTAAQRGHDVVLAPAPTLYLDQLQSVNLDETAGRTPEQSLATVYAFEPVPKELDAAQADHVLGAQANAWTEHMPTMKHVEHAVFPRMDALAELDWSPPSARDWASFTARLEAQFTRYRVQGIGFADSAFAAKIAVDRNAALTSGMAQVTLSNQAGSGKLHYTVDGSVPDATSPTYGAPFTVALPTTVRAVTLAADGGTLAAPRERVLDRNSLLTIAGNAMPNCPGSDFRLRVQPMPDATSLAPVYSINVFNSCQLLPSMPMDQVVGIHVDAVRLERNFALAHDAKLVVSRPHSTPFGELAVHLDHCDGPLLASMPLPDPAHSARRFSLDASLHDPMRSAPLHSVLAAPLHGSHGEHALCLIYTAPIDGPLYALDQVSLLRGPVIP